MKKTCKIVNSKRSFENRMLAMDIYNICFQRERDIRYKTINEIYEELTDAGYKISKQKICYLILSKTHYVKKYNKEKVLYSILGIL